jgi:hypothetical protein
MAWKFKSGETIFHVRVLGECPFHLYLPLMKTIRILALLFLLPISIGIIAGCSKSSTSPPNTTPPATPAVGSTFTTIDNNSDTTYNAVLATTLPDTAHHGCTSVELSQTNAANNGVDIYYESLLTDGDLAIEGASSGWGNPGVFEVLPFVTHTTVIDTFTQNDNGTIVRDSVVSMYDGPGKPFVLNNQTYQTDSVTVTAFFVGMGASLQYGYSFIPALGLIAYYNNGSTIQWLISYTPK